MTDFERKVLSDLAELKTQMRALVGDGNAGRMHELELKVAEHDVFVQRASGFAAVAAALITMFHLGIDLFRAH